MMNLLRHFVFISLFAATLVPAGLSATLRVVASTPDFGSIAEAVGGERVQVTTLARPGEDPHFVVPRPSFIPILNRADVLIEGGADLEAGWLPPLVQTARNRDILPGGRGYIAVARHIDLMDVPNGTLDRSLGHVHASGNPHFMLDPENGVIAARLISERLAELDPDGVKVYRENYERFAARVEEGFERWQEKLAPYKGTRVVTYHKNFNYLARRFGFEITDEIEPLAGVEPSPRHLVELISSMRELDVPMIWIEPFRPHRTPARIADQSGARLVALPEQVGAVEGTEDYVALFDHIVDQIEDAMEAEQVTE